MVLRMGKQIELGLRKGCDWGFGLVIDLAHGWVFQMGFLRALSWVGRKEYMMVQRMEKKIELGLRKGYDLGFGLVPDLVNDLVL